MLPSSLLASHFHFCFYFFLFLLYTYWTFCFCALTLITMRIKVMAVSWQAYLEYAWADEVSTPYCSVMHHLFLSWCLGQKSYFMLLTKVFRLKKKGLFLLFHACVWNDCKWCGFLGVTNVYVNMGLILFTWLFQICMHILSAIHVTCDAHLSDSVKDASKVF